MSNQITLLDPFSAPPPSSVVARSDGGSGGAKIRQVNPPPIAQKPKIVEQSAFYSQNSISFQPVKPFDDPLNNGKCLIAAPNVVAMPTIIKPVIMAKPMGVPQKEIRMKWKVMRGTSEEQQEKTPSPPMPIYAPPPPPPEFYAEVGGEVEEEEKEDEQSYGIALYDYESEFDGDLNFRVRNGGDD